MSVDTKRLRSLLEACRGQWDMEIETSELEGLLDWSDLLEGIVREVAAPDPTAEIGRRLVCFYCDGRVSVGEDTQHAADCPWVRARAAIGGGE